MLRSSLSFAIDTHMLPNIPENTAMLVAAISTIRSTAIVISVPYIRFLVLLNISVFIIAYPGGNFKHVCK